jgi:ligand-binding sensor domain-containing protein
MKKIILLSVFSHIIIGYSQENPFRILTQEEVCQDANVLQQSIHEGIIEAYWYVDSVEITRRIDSICSIEEGVISNHLSPFMFDDNGNIWMGSEGQGLNVFIKPNDPNASRFEYFTEENGLSKNIVWSITMDEKKNMWIGTENGIGLFKTNKQHDNADRKFSINNDFEF